MNKQKTILLPIYNGTRARNFFRFDTYKTLVSDPNIKLVVVVPSVKADFYRKEFNESNVVFEPLDVGQEPLFGRVLAEFAFNLFNTNTVRMKQRLEYFRYGNYPRYIIMRVLNRALSPFFPATRAVIRFFEKFVPINNEISEVLKKYDPNMVLLPDIVFPIDRLFMRAAKKKNYFVMGLVRSWDNLTSKGVVQILPDKMVVLNSVMKNEAMKYVGMAENRILISGSPQYDIYFNKKYPIKSKKEFFAQLGIPEGRRLILCAPFFNDYIKSAIKIINTLTDSISDGRLPNDLHLLVRFRPNSAEIPEGRLKFSNHLTISRPCQLYFDNMGGLVKQDYEFTESDVELLFNSIYFSDVTINTISTLSIDAAALDKPVINVRFDAEPLCPKKHSVEQMVGHDHYEAIEKSGGVALANSMEQLIQQLSDYLKNSKLHVEGRNKMRDVQIEFMDGQSGKRVAGFIFEELKNL